MTMVYEVRRASSGVDYLRASASGAITQADAQGYLDRVQPGRQYGHLPVLVIATDPTIDVHSEARAIFGAKDMALRDPHTLLVLNSAPMRVLVGFLLRMSGGAAKTTLFGSEAAAVAWLDALPSP